MTGPSDLGYTTLQLLAQLCAGVRKVRVERADMKTIAGMKVKKLEVTFTPEYYARFEAYCKRKQVTPDEMIGQLIALEMNPPNVVWGPWKPAA